MKAPTQVAPDTAPDNRGNPEKKPYAAPRVVFRERIEAIAAVCAPAPPAKGNPGQCPSGPISS